MDKQNFLSLLEKVVEAQPGSISMESELESVGWDSVGQLSLLAEIDRLPGVGIDMESMKKARYALDLFVSITSD